MLLCHIYNKYVLYSCCMTKSSQEVVKHKTSETLLKCRYLSKTIIFLFPFFPFFSSWKICSHSALCFEGKKWSSITKIHLHHLFVIPQRTFKVKTLQNSWTEQQWIVAAVLGMKFITHRNMTDYVMGNKVPSAGTVAVCEYGSPKMTEAKRILLFIKWDRWKAPWVDGSRWWGDTAPLDGVPLSVVFATCLKTDVFLWDL